MDWQKRVLLKIASAQSATVVYHLPEPSVPQLSPAPSLPGEHGRAVLSLLMPHVGFISLSPLLSRGSRLRLAWQSTSLSLPPPGLQARSPLTPPPSARWSPWIWGSRSSRRCRSSRLPPRSWVRMRKSPPRRTLMSPTPTWPQLSSSA